MEKMKCTFCAKRGGKNIENRKLKNKNERKKNCIMLDLSD